MSLLRITNGFDQTPDAKLIERTYSIWQQMNGNANFPSPAPSMTELSTALANFQEAVQRAAGGDRLLIAEKYAKRNVLVHNLHVLGYYVLYASGGDRIKAQTSGYAFAKEPTPIVITKPVDLKVNNTNQTGQLTVSVKTVKGAAAYMHQFTTDPLLKEESWQSAANSTAKCKLTGLKPGTTYYVRVGVVGRKDQVMYSDVVSRIAA